jgi:hypothetical protein
MAIYINYNSVYVAQFFPKYHQIHLSIKFYGYGALMANLTTKFSENFICFKTEI